MRKALAIAEVAAFLLLAGCVVTEPRPRSGEREDPPVVAQAERCYCSVGEEVPPAEVLGRTYDKAEQLQPTTKFGQVSTGLQWLWSILGSQLK